MEPDSPEQLAAHVRSRLSGLRSAEARVAQVVLEQGGDLVRLSVSDVAALASTAQSTVVRACQRLGFQGFQALKIAAARQGPPRPAESGGDPLTVTVRATREALDGLATTVSADGLRAAAEALGAASRVLVVGAGLSGAVALDAAYRLRALGAPVDAPVDAITARLTARLLPAGAVCLVVSHTGATRASVDIARDARLAGATVVALTSYAHSPLTEVSSHVLLAGGQDVMLGLEAVASRIAHLAIVDALVLTLRSLRGGDADHTLAVSAEVTADHTY